MDKKEKPKRTDSQNRALHLWLSMKAEQCRDAGITAQMAFAKTIELEMSPEMMKVIWKEVQKVMLKKTSTTQLNKSNGEIENVAEHLNRFFAEDPFNLEGIEFPHNEHKSDLMEGMKLQENLDYPEEDNQLDKQQF